MGLSAGFPGGRNPQKRSRKPVLYPLSYEGGIAA